ncbi:CoA-binding protein [Methylobacterium indicum]|uniref:CoA-binding protein n=1 Tax=Methylobacterium indicum TaxID=1775910 RepID=A0A0J6RKE2_9HYPH|nr:CoA-binding protein [Methylobacterium indicum]KMO21712.1 CoA-binding protein [Methylobacterium indicum]KMO26647.1 CoA-binding protein [Methylobacterium indicum]BCM83972.1 CoA-binding protein [Methylobacterium indicum]
MTHDRYDDEALRKILQRVRSIALVGASANPARPSWIVTKYLLERGYQVIPVNPGLAGTDLLGRPVVARLADLAQPVDMVEIFRNSEAAGPLVDEALALDPLPGVIWMQLGVRNDEAAARAEARGVTVVMNRCPKIEYGRLSGEIGWTGVNSRILSAKRPKLAAKGFQKLTIEER